MKKTFSLKRSLILLVVACWILPLLAVTCIASFVVARNINAQVTRTAAATANAAAQICVERVDAAIEGSRFASYDKTITRAFRDWTATGDPVDFYREVNAFLTQLYKFDNKYLFTSLRFYNTDKESLAPLADMELYTFNESLFPRWQAGGDAYRAFLAQDADPILEHAAELGTAIGFLNREGRLYLLRNIYLEGAAPTGVLAMRLNTQSWFASMEEVPWSTGVTIALDQVSYPIRGEPEELEALRRDPGALGGQIPRRDYDFTYRVGVNNTVLLENVRKLQYAILAMELLVIPLLAVVIRFFHKSVTRPIQVLAKGADQIREGAFGVQVTGVSRSREFTRLTDAFNDMSAQLQHQFERIYHKELALQDARIMALQSQINPHFLGNTLEIIGWEARFVEADKVSRMIEALSTMLDAAMDRSGNPVVHLAQEIMYLDAYLYIIGERLGKRLTVVKEIDESLLDLYVPRLVLQPVIENAVEHGVAPRQKGRIAIRVYREADNLVLEIENDSAASQEDLDRIHRLLADTEGPFQEGSGRSLGIRNVHQRLRILYGPQSGLDIKVTRTGSTLAKIIIPIDQGDNNMQ